MKRRVTYITVLLSVIGFISGWYIFVNTYEPPTCFDGKQNDLELGIDCGGACTYLCTSQVQDPIVLFSRSFEVAPGVYNSVAYVENPNFDIGNRSIQYIFKLYDDKNELIAERKGHTFVNVGVVAAIFEGTIVTDGKVPKRTTFEFVDNGRWRKVDPNNESPFLIRNQQLVTPETRPKVRAVIENKTVNEYRDVEVVTVVFNALNNAIATSRTIIDVLPKRASQQIVFTWPEPFDSELEACVVPVDVTLLFDVSGSMNDDGDDPPQPLTDAKEAAAAFAERLEPKDRLGLISFATKADILKSFSSQHRGTARQIRAIEIDPEEEFGATNMGAAFSKAVGMLQSDTAERDQISKIAVLLTDGIANEPAEPGGEPFALEHAKKAKDAGYNVYTIGLGENVNEEFLKTIATQSEPGEPSYYFKAATSQDLIGVYEDISDSICERGAAIVDIIPRF